MMKRFVRDRHVLGVRQQSLSVVRQSIDGDGLEIPDLGQVGKEQRRQSRRAGSIEIGFGGFPCGIGHRAGTANGRRGRPVAAGGSRTVAIK